ncbi:MAG TPA: xanthine dehydrogenase family protein molybdopterin-binding subunit [Stellaceae bacterium]|nr:xanthine dehydrogenase family protein molybdopterin-binding subunit [Stellaceae bacterium]
MTENGKTPSPSLIGASVPQVTARAKVTGAAQYVADMKMAGMLHAKILRSPYPHARIVGIDTSRARVVKGVRLVVTGEDVPERRWGVIKKDQHILARDKVRFVGQEVAAVVAIDENTAIDALELIHVEYEQLPAVFDPASALEPGAPEIHDGTGNLAWEVRIDRGDVEAGFKRAAAVYEATYDMPYQYPGYMEPMGTIAAPDGSGRLTIWAPVQSIFSARARLCDALDLSPSKIRVIQTVTGGGFGGKVTEDSNTVIAGFLALKARRPVRLINNRLEDFLSAHSSVPARVWLKMGLAKDGEILAKESSIIADNGAYTGLATSVTYVTAMRTDSMHRLQNVRTHARLAYTNKIPSGAFRGMGLQQMAFPLNSHIAMLAEMIGMDPVDVHLRNAIRTGETSVHGWHMGSVGLSECLIRARDGIGWKDKYQRRQSQGARRRGVGIGAAIHVSGNRARDDWEGASVIVRVNEDGRIVLITGESDIGQGSQTVLSQICAHELGIPIDHVTVAAPDTDSAPFSIGSISSRVTTVAGNAAIRASRLAREKLLAVVSQKLEVASADLVIEDGFIHVVGARDHGMSIADAARHHIFRSGGEGIYAHATFDAPSVVPDKNFYGNVSTAYSFAATAVEVEVDTQTGQVRIVDSLAVDDCGKALNPLAVHGQTNGATAQGIAWALYEKLEFQDGQLINGNFADYTLPTADSLPHLRSGIVESNDPNGPYGAKGASETAVAPPAGAIANAIYDAIGIRFNTLPIKPEDVLKALQNQGASGKSNA